MTEAKLEATDQEDVRQVLQVERRDFTQLVPTDRPQVQSMRGFDPIYTDIVDYIVRCTHKIWDERDVGLIYTHYTHNCVLYGVLGTMYDRESIVRETIQRIVELPDRRGMATSVIWRGNDVDGFYTSHMTHGTGRHTEYGVFGKPTGRTFVTRTIVDCMILENKIYREWVARDNMAQLVQLGIDPHVVCCHLSRSASLRQARSVVEISENRQSFRAVSTGDRAGSLSGSQRTLKSPRCFGGFITSTTSACSAKLAKSMPATVSGMGRSCESSMASAQSCSRPCASSP